MTNRSCDDKTEVDCQQLGRKEGRKHGALRPKKPLRLIRDGEVGGSGFFCNFLSVTYLLLCHHQNDSELRLSLIHI